MKADVWWVVGGALAVFLTVVGVLVDRYLLAVWWWPLVGTEWRAERAWNRECAQIDLPGPGRDSSPHSDDGLVNQPGSTPGRATGTWAGEPDGDDAWVEQLHVINLDAHRDRPVALLTHYEVEAVIRDLGVPEWVPQRLRAA